LRGGCCLDSEDGGQQKPAVTAAGQAGIDR